MFGCYLLACLLVCSFVCLCVCLDWLFLWLFVCPSVCRLVGWFAGRSVGWSVVCLSVCPPPLRYCWGYGDGLILVAAAEYNFKLGVLWHLCFLLLVANPFLALSSNMSSSHPSSGHLSLWCLEKAALETLEGSPLAGSAEASTPLTPDRTPEGHPCNSWIHELTVRSQQIVKTSFWSFCSHRTSWHVAHNTSIWLHLSIAAWCRCLCGRDRAHMVRNPPAFAEGTSRGMQKRRPAH